MSEVLADDQLRQVRRRLGGLTFLDYSTLDLRSAHLELGKNVRSQVHKILHRRLERSNQPELAELLRQGRACRESLVRRAAEPGLEPRLRTAIQEYLDSLSAWAEGVELAGFEHPALAPHRPLSAQDLALLLQNDFAGCQTGMYRRQDGSVILWHTEEDVEEQPGDSFDQLRLLTCKVEQDGEPVKLHAFIYPDLLPGPTFGWRSDGFTQALDVLHIRLLGELEVGTLANIASWITLRLGASLPLSQTLEALHPFFDGYALNAMYTRQGEVVAEKYEFAGDCLIPHRLGEQSGSYLFQVNIFCQHEHPQARGLEDLPPENWNDYHQREVRTQDAMRQRGSDHRSAPEDMRFFFELLASRQGDEWAYANRDVKAYFLQRLTPQGSETWLGHGPAMADDPYRIIQDSGAASAPARRTPPPVPASPDLP